MSDQNEERLTHMQLLNAIGNVILGSNAYLLSYNMDVAQSTQVQEWIMLRHNDWEVKIKFTKVDQRLMISCSKKK